MYNSLFITDTKKRNPLKFRLGHVKFTQPLCKRKMEIKENLPKSDKLFKNTKNNFVL